MTKRVLFLILAFLSGVRKRVSVFKGRPLRSDILYQCAALGNADELMPAADAQDGKPCLLKNFLCQLHVKSVSTLRHEVVFPLGATAIIFRPIIIPPNKNKSVQPGENPIQHRHIRIGRNAKGRPPCPNNGVDIIGRNEEIKFF
jgi:hypothetical protein